MVPRAGAHTKVRAWLALLLLAHLFISRPFCYGSPADDGKSTAAPDQEMVVALELDKEGVSDSFLLVEKNGQLFIPVCSLAETLSLAIHCEEKRAYGFVLSEGRPFVLDLDEGYAVHGREAFSINGEAFVQKGEILVNAGALSRWLPVDFYLRRETSTLELKAREPLPLQALKKRQTFVAPKPQPQAKPYPDATPPRQAASTPAVDLASQLSLGSDGARGNHGKMLNSMDVAGDFLYMTGEAHLLALNDDLKRLDVTMSRRSASGYRAGPLWFNQIAFGSTQAPYVDGVGASTKPLYGVFVSNRPLIGSGQFLSHDIHGQLPAGWDAELFHNGTQIRYQPPTAEGMYHFVNLRVYYGVNSFKVVLHGPFGERKETEEVFVSDATTPRGELLYTLSAGWQTGLAHHEDAEAERADSNLTFTSDFGLSRNLTGSLVVVRSEERVMGGREYVGAGARTAFRSTLLSLEVIQALGAGGGSDGQLVSVKSSSRDVLGLNLELVQRFFHNYESPQFFYRSDPLRTLTSLKGNSSFTIIDKVRVPYSVELGFGTKRSGQTETTSQWRVSGGWNGWSGTLQADLSRLQGNTSATGQFQVSTRLSNVSVRGEAGYAFAPTAKARSINLSADLELRRGLQFNSALSHNPGERVTDLRAGLSKRYGQVGYSVSAHGSTDGAYGVDVGVRSSVAAGPDGQLLVSAEPLAPYGMIAISTTVAAPEGRKSPLPGVAVLLNGSRAKTLPGSAGTQVIGFLQPDVPVDVAIDMTSVEDPFMVPVEEGCRVVPRAGVVARCDFTLTSGGEIDGTVMVRLGRGREVPIKQVKVELLREEAGQGHVQATTLSEESGYYLFKTVKPGRYLVRVAPEEVERLKAGTLPPRAVTMPSGGDMISGVDFALEAADGVPAKIINGPEPVLDQD